MKASHAIGLAYGIAGLGNAAGPLIGGLLTDTVGWRWIFWLDVPLTVVSLALGAWSVAESSDRTAPRAATASIIAGIGLFTLTFDRAPTLGLAVGGDSRRVRRVAGRTRAFVVVERPGAMAAEVEESVAGAATPGSRCW